MGSPVVPDVENITARVLSKSSAGWVFPVNFSLPEIFSFPNLAHGHDAPLRADSSFSFTLSDSITAKGFKRPRVFKSEISPVFSFSGQNTPPSLHVARIIASVIGEFGINTASLCPSVKPEALRISVHSSASLAKSFRLIHS